MDNLVLEVRPDQITSYGKLHVAFYDVIVKKAMVDDEGDKILNAKGQITLVDKSELYIHIDNGEDRKSKTRRKVISRKVPVGPYKELQLKTETELFARAYNKYLETKKNGGISTSQQAEFKAKEKEFAAREAILAAREAKANTSNKEASKAALDLPQEKSAIELKAELDSKGIEYKGNSSKEVLLEKLAR